MKIVIPREIHHRPLRLWGFIAARLLRARPGYFAILPLCLGLGLAAAGWSPGRIAAAAAASWLFSWIALATHEYGHATQLLRESLGYATVWLDVRGGGFKSIASQLAWIWHRIALALALRGIRLPAGRMTTPPEAGYLRVGTDMTLAARAKMRIALAGPATPLLLWAALALALPALLWRGPEGAFETAAAVLAAGLAYLIAQPFFSGLIYNGKAYSDLAYATNYLLQELDFRQANPLRILALAGQRIARQVPALLADQLAFLFQAGSLLHARDMAEAKPKRTCLAWVYKRDEKGEFTDRVIILAPLGLALLKQLTANPHGETRAQLERLLANPAQLRRKISYRKVYSIELSRLASRAWELADGELSVREIAVRIADESRRPLPEVQAALESFFRDLHRKYIVNLCWPLEPVRQYPTLPDVLFDHGDVGVMMHRMLAEA